MRNKIVMTIIASLLFMCTKGWCASYYVDYTSGSNSSAGTSESTAWKTIDYMDDHSYTGGDNIYLKKGGRVEGTIYSTLIWYK